MTGDEMGRVLERIGWSPATLAARLGIRVDTVRQWLAGRRAIPPNLETWLIQLAEHMDQAPALPDGWRSGGGC